jgi:hypothetical protein
MSHSIGLPDPNMKITTDNPHSIRIAVPIISKRSGRQCESCMNISVVPSLEQDLASTEDRNPLSSRRFESVAMSYSSGFHRHDSN